MVGLADPAVYEETTVGLANPESAVTQEVVYEAVYEEP